MIKRSLILVFILSSTILATGCMIRSGMSVPAAPETTAAVVYTPVPATSFVSPVPTTFGPGWPAAPLVGEYTTTPTTRPAADNPFLEELAIKKRTFVNPLPDCFMEHAFPAIAMDPGYGIKQVHPKLAYISEHDYDDFLEEFTEGVSEDTALKTPAVCQNTGNEPVWNFAEVRIVLIPTNPTPSDYTISENILSDGKIIARFESTERLVIDETRVITRYVLLHADEVDLFDSVEVTFTRH